MELSTLCVRAAESVCTSGDGSFHIVNGHCFIGKLGYVSAPRPQRLLPVIVLVGRAADVLRPNIGRPSVCMFVHPSNLCS